jgi:hypothetical protein
VKIAGVNWPTSIRIYGVRNVNKMVFSNTSQQRSVRDPHTTIHTACGVRCEWQIRLASRDQSNDITLDAYSHKRGARVKVYTSGMHVHIVVPSRNSYIERWFHKLMIRLDNSICPWIKYALAD